MSDEAVMWKEKFFHADCTLDGLCGVVKECCEMLLNAPGREHNPEGEAILIKLEDGLLEVEREYTKADAPQGRTEESDQDKCPECGGTRSLVLPAEHRSEGRQCFTSQDCDARWQKDA